MPLHPGVGTGRPIWADENSGLRQGGPREGDPPTWELLERHLVEVSTRYSRAPSCSVRLPPHWGGWECGEDGGIPDVAWFLAVGASVLRGAAQRECEAGWVCAYRLVVCVDHHVALRKVELLQWAPHGTQFQLVDVERHFLRTPVRAFLGPWREGKGKHPIRCRKHRSIGTVWELGHENVEHTPRCLGRARTSGPDGVKEGSDETGPCRGDLPIYINNSKNNSPIAMKFSRYIL